MAGFEPSCLKGQKSYALTTKPVINILYKLIKSDMLFPRFGKDIENKSVVSSFKFHIIFLQKFFSCFRNSQLQININKIKVFCNSPFVLEIHDAFLFYSTNWHFILWVFRWKNPPSWTVFKFCLKNWWILQNYLGTHRLAI